MAGKIVNVTQCGNCPLKEYNSEYNENYCSHPDMKGDNDIIYLDKILEDCPLKVESITIQLV